MEENRHEGPFFYFWPKNTNFDILLFGVQVLQTIVYYKYIGIVFNNFGTVAKAIFSLYHDPG